MILTRPKDILPSLQAMDKEAVLCILAQAASQAAGLEEATILDALLERERLGCTGVGQGFSIPHARFSALKEPYGLFARLTPPVDFGATDGQPVDLVFLLLSPSGSDAEHLKALARIARMFRDPTFTRKLRDAPDGETLYSLLDMALNENISR